MCLLGGVKGVLSGWIWGGALRKNISDV